MIIFISIPTWVPFAICMGLLELSGKPNGASVTAKGWEKRVLLSLRLASMPRPWLVERLEVEATKQ